MSDSAVRSSTGGTSWRAAATPTQSNPAPRFEVEPGTRTVTLARMAASGLAGTENARASAAGGRFLAPCLTWRQYATNHHGGSRYVCSLVTVKPGDRQAAVPGYARETEGPMGRIRGGILGATGTVGQRFLALLANH